MLGGRTACEQQRGLGTEAGPLGLTHAEARASRMGNLTARFGLGSSEAWHFVKKDISTSFPWSRQRHLSSIPTVVTHGIEGQTDEAALRGLTSPASPDPSREVCAPRCVRVTLTLNLSLCLDVFPQIGTLLYGDAGIQ